jgi:hypothetical protein
MAQTNPFDQFDAPAAQSGPVFGPPPSVNETQRTANDTAKTQIDVAKGPAEIRKANADAAKTDFDLQQERKKQDQARSDAVTSLTEVLGKLETIYGTEKNATLPVTGWAGDKLSDIPGTAAHDVQSDLQTVNANAAFGALQRMRESSPTGGALGQVSEGELALLRSTIANLQQSQSREQWLRNLGEAKAHYLKILGTLDPATAQQFRDRKDGIPLPGGGDNKALPAVTPGATPPTGTAPGGPGGGGSGGPGGPVDPAMRGGLPIGSQIVFGMDRPDPGPFDRDAYLNSHFGITPDQETRIVAFWNQNGRNQTLTPENVRAWYASAGIPAPEGAALEKSIADAKAGKQFAPIDTSAAEKAYKDELQGRLNAEGFNPNSADAYGGRAMQGATLGNSDELSGLAGAAGALVQGKNPVTAYQETRDTARLALEQEREKQGLAGHVAEFGGGLIPGLFTGGAADTGSMVRTGASLGALAGYGYGNGAGGSLAGAVTGGVTGGLLGKAGGTIADYVSSRSAARAAARSATPSEGANVVQAADRLNTQLGTDLSPMPADVSGPGIRNLTGGMAKFPFSAQPIVAGAKNVLAQAQKARDAIAGLVGNATEVETAGESALSGAQAAIKSTKANVDRLYRQADQLGGMQRIEPVLAREALDRNITELSQTPGGADGLKVLQGLRDELGPNSGKSWTLDGIRNMRTQLRDKFMAEGLTRSDIERRVGQVLDAADQDITNNLTAAGKTDAAAAYKAASQAHSERMDLIENVISPIIGNDPRAPFSGEQIMAKINAMTQHNNARLGRFLNALPADDQATVRATIISRLGRASNGQQNAEGDVFSLTHFLTQWNGMTPGAKRTLFGPQVRSALDDLATVANGTKEAQKFANFSNTGSTIGIGLTGAGLTGAVSHPLATISAALAQYGGGRLLASPAFARWLAKAPSVRPSAMPAYIAKLSNVAAENGAIAADIQGVQNVLMGSIGRSPVRATAATSGDDKQN